MSGSIALAWMLLVGCKEASPVPGPNVPGPAPVATTQAMATPSALPRHFKGSWRDPVEQIVFAFDLRLEPGEASFKGRILWTLIATPPGHPLASRVDEVGTEFVTGSWEASTRTLRLEGTHVDSTLLATDQYRLVVSADGKTFAGKTRGNKGTWENDIDGERVE